MAIATQEKNVSRLFRRVAVVSILILAAMAAGVAVERAVSYYQASQPIHLARGDGGAAQAAQHLAMLMGVDVAGFSPHPGRPDPEGRDRKHNAEGLRNTLRSIRRNMRRGESIQEYLARKGWAQRQIEEFVEAVQEYLKHVLETDVASYNVGQELADEIISLAAEIGAW